MNDETQASLARLLDMLELVATLGAVWVGVEVVWSILDLWRSRG